MNQDRPGAVADRGIVLLKAAASRVRKGVMSLLPRAILQRLVCTDCTCIQRRSNKIKPRVNLQLASCCYRLLITDCGQMAAFGA